MKAYSPKKTGEASEAQVLALFLKHEMVALIPFGDSQRYDMVVDEGGSFIRVQCRTGHIEERNEGAFVFSTQSINWNTLARKTYKGDADVFAVYLRENDSVYIFNVDSCPNRMATVRLVPTKSGQKKGCRLAKDHLFSPQRSLLDYP